MCKRVRQWQKLSIPPAPSTISLVVDAEATHLRGLVARLQTAVLSRMLKLHVYVGIFTLTYQPFTLLFWLLCY